MPRKKIEPPIEGLTKDPEAKLVVQKSLPLFALWRSDFTLAEFKILDTYLARIDSRKPEKRAVKFTKGELEDALGVQKINISDLKERVARLMQPLIIQTDKHSFKGLALFEEADCHQDPQTGLWTVSLECTHKAMKYFFGIEELGYLRYKLRSITNLKSRYSYVLFTYLESNRFRKSWVVSLDELRKLLNCENEEYTREYKRFNDRLLKRCQTELHEKTELRYAYEAVKTGRTVSGVRFTVETLSDEALSVERDPNQHHISEYVDGSWAAITEASDEETPPMADPVAEKYNDALDTISEACDNEFEREQVEEINNYLASMRIYDSPDNPTNRYDYVRKKYLTFKTQAAQNEKRGKPIKFRFKYFKTVLMATK